MVIVIYVLLNAIFSRDQPAGIERPDRSRINRR